MARFYRYGRDGTWPDWLCSNGPAAALRKEFTRRTLAELRRRRVHSDEGDLPAADVAELAPTTDEEILQRAIRQGDAGDVSLLKELYPRISRFICVPERDRRGRPEGRVRHRDEPSWALPKAQAAAEDVYVIQEIWRDVYGRRRRAIAPTAVKIAADSNNVDQRAILEWMNKHPRR